MDVSVKLGDCSNPTCNGVPDVVLSCGHVFCSNFLIEWRERNAENSCPMGERCGEILEDVSPAGTLEAAQRRVNANDDMENKQIHFTSADGENWYRVTDHTDWKKARFVNVG